MPIQRKINDVDIRLLRIFKAVVECGGFSAAEAQLNIARSTISTHMADLESRLELTLCHRGRGGFSLTDEGRVVYEATDQLLASLETFRSQVNGLHQQLTGELRIVCSDAIVSDPRLRLTEAITRFEAAAPDVVLNITTDTLPEIEQALIDGSVDIGFAPWHRELSTLSYHPLYKEDYFLYCYRNHPLFDIDPDELDEAAISRSKFIHPGIQTSRQATRAMSGLNRAATAYIYEVRLAMMKSGRYIGFFPSHYIKEFLAEGEMRALLPERHHYAVEVSAMTPRGQRSNKLRELFMEQLEAVYRD